MCLLFHKFAHWEAAFAPNSYTAYAYQNRVCTRCGLIEQRTIGFGHSPSPSDPPPCLDKRNLGV